MRRLGYRVVDILVEHFSQMKNRSVGAKADPARMRPLLAGPPQDAPGDPDALLSFLEREVFPNLLHVDHPRFFAFVPGPNNFMSTIADALSAGFNVFNGTWMGGSSAAALELGVIDWLRTVCGFPETGGGLFVSGGSVANMTALVAARHALLNDDTTGATVYFSDQTHSSVERALRVIGFHANQLRKLEPNVHFELQVDTLRAAVAADRAKGLRPFCVIANAGTTNTGAVDPLNDLADFCAEQGMWLHADGAYGAASMLSHRGRLQLAGIERVHSLSLDPHKWLFQSFECGCVLLRDAALLKAAFQIMPEYLQDVHRGHAEVHPCDYGVQLTRSFRALKVWLSVRTFGLDAFRTAITRGFELAEFAEAELRRKGWEILSPARMGIVCFRYQTQEPGPLVDAMLHEGFAFLTSTKLHGIGCLRLCTINPRTTEADLTETIDRLTRLALDHVGAERAG